MLAGLTQLQEVECDFLAAQVAAVALAGCSSFRGSIGQGAAAPAPSSLKCGVRDLRAFDTAAVECMELLSLGMGGMAAMCQALARCAELRALQVSADKTVQLSPLLQAVAGCKHLQHLHLNLWQKSPMDDEHLLVLLGRCRQLTLSGISNLSTGTTAALMLLPRLRLLHLLGCNPCFSQDEAQALVGQLQALDLQVDVVVRDGSVRAR